MSKGLKRTLNRVMYNHPRSAELLEFKTDLFKGVKNIRMRLKQQHCCVCNASGEKTQLIWCSECGLAVCGACAVVVDLNVEEFKIACISCDRANFEKLNPTRNYSPGVIRIQDLNEPLRTIFLASGAKADEEWKISPLLLN